MHAELAYPDSVRRVKPPKTTMPKTLAALPSNQYATLLSFCLGNQLFLADCGNLLFLAQWAGWRGAPASIDPLKAPSGVWERLTVSAVWVDDHRMVRRMGLWQRRLRSDTATLGFAGLRQGLQVKNSGERRGAPRLKAGKAAKNEAMAEGRPGRWWWCSRGRKVTASCGGSTAVHPRGES